MSATFRYANPLQISWGTGAVAELAAAIGDLGADRVLLVSTGPVLANDGLMELFYQALPGPPVATAAIGGHAPIADVGRTLGLRMRSKADVVVSLGGGGAIDAAKAVARGQMETGQRVGVTDRASHTAHAIPPAVSSPPPPAPAPAPPASAGTNAASSAATPASTNTGASGNVLPHLAVPTTLSAAELSWRAGFADAKGDKVGFADRQMLPTAVFYEPRLAVFTPLALWLSTGIRAIDHAVEGFMAAGSHPFSDVLAIEAIARLDGALRASAANPADLEARAQAQVGAWFSYTLPLDSMTGLSHQMGKQIGARHGIGHGDTSALLIDRVMRYRARQQPGRYQELGKALNSRFGDGREANAADRIEELVVALNLPRHAADFGVTATDLAKAAAEIATEQYPARELAEVYRESL